MTRIKLMIDHNYWSITNRLNDISGKVQAATTSDYGFAGETPDPDLVKATKDHGCILFTRDRKTITRKRYKPCTHGGIILFQPRLVSDEDVFKIVKAFCLSGDRKHAIGHVTHLHSSHATIYTHKETIIVRWQKSRGRLKYSRTVLEKKG